MPTEKKPDTERVVTSLKKKMRHVSIVNRKFFDLFETDLIKRIGPVAKFLIDDYIYEMGEHRDNFPRSRINDLISKVSIEIENKAEREEFKRKMLSTFEKTK